MQEMVTFQHAAQAVSQLKWLDMSSGDVTIKRLVGRACSLHGD